MPFYNQHSTVIAGVSSLPTAYTIDNSLRFRNSSTGYLYRDVTTTGNRKTFTYSCWLKITKVDTTQIFSCGTSGSSVLQARIVTNNGLQIYQESGGTTNFQRYTGSSAYLRDFSAWYHIVFVVDTTQATAGDRVKVYLNGVQLTSFSSSTDPSLNYDTLANYNDMWVGSYIGNVTSDTYQTEVHFLDGYAATADDFGEFDGVTGVWKPKEYVGGNYGTNGFYLPMTATTQADGFNTVLYTGNGASQSIGDVGFSPDFVWIKKRSGVENHGLFDTVRGPNYFFVSNASTGEYARGNSITTIDSDGFSLGDYSNTNVSGGTNVAWCWDAGANQATTGISSVAYTGTGAARPVAGFGFSPDLVIAKARSAGSPLLYDSVRGAGYFLQPNSTGAESYDLTRLASYDADGFSYGSFATGTNAAGTEYIAWGWDAGSGDPVTNTDGTITSTVKANDATGFSIVSYTGDGGADSVGHGLSTAPDVVILKDRDNATYIWCVYHKDLTSGHYLRLDTSAASTLNATVFGDGTSGVAPDSTKFYIGGNAAVNTSSDKYIAYCFSEVSGVSKFGSYTGTGTSGKAITGLGFRPGFLMIKETSSTGNWAIVDGTRSPFSETAGDYLWMNLSDAEGGASAYLTLDDDGFTINSGDSDTNASGQTYIYMAFKGSYSDYVSPLNTDGDIDSRVKANTTKGFSVVSYEGDGSASSAVGHGLSSSAEMIILKDREVTNNWRVWHKDLSTNYWMYLNLTNTQASAATDGGLRNVNATTFGFINGTTAGVEAVNTSGRGYIAYCWHSVSGYSSFGSYTGTGSSGNTVTDLGFQPAFLMIKNRDSSANWMMYDNTRDPSNEAGKRIYGDLSNAEQQVSPYDVEFTATGFTLNNTGVSINASGDTYIYMAFADTRDAQFNFDASGNKNNFTANNINSNASSEPSYDIMTDVPTLTDENTANYCTLVPYTFRTSHGAPMTLSEGNLKAVPIASTAASVVASMSPSSGKFYWEITFPVVASASTGYGLCTTENVQSASTGASGIYYTRGSGGTIVSGGSTVASSVGVPAAGDIMSIAYDADANEATFRLKNVVLGTGAYSVPTTSNLLPFIYMASTSNAAYANFGQRPFKYTPPDGFLPLNTYNLPDATIVDGSKQFNTVLYTGDGGSARAVTGVGFQPDFAWFKARNTTYSHQLVDAVRGAGNVLFSNLTNAEGAINTVTSFDSDGVTVDASTYTGTNGSGDTFASWYWKANGSGVSNSDGSITSTVSANTTSGFSIVSFNAGAAGNHTVGHGLGVTPEMIIMKDRDSSGYGNWTVFHSAVCTSTSNYLLLNGTGALGSVANSWGSALPTSTVFGFGSNVNVAANDNIIAYCFAGVEGFSSIGSYTGNGSTDGPFVYTGFRPAWLLIKHTTSTESWYIFDAERSTYNAVNDYLLPNATNAEATNVTARDHDFLSNGFKIRNTNGAMNTSGSVYIYAAFAENPFKNALAR